MSKELEKGMEMENVDDMDLEVFQFESEAYDFPDFNTNGDSQEAEVDKSQADPMGLLEQEVIDKHEEYLNTLNQIVKQERDHVDEMYEIHQPVVNLNRELKEELAIMKEKIDHAIHILSKMKALLE